MRHRKGIRKLSKPTDQRLAMLRSMTREFFKHGSIRVTEKRGKEARRMVEGVIELAKRGDLSARRRAISVVRDPDVVKKVFSDLGSRYSGRKGGYTRLTKIGTRRGDASPMVLLELV